MNRLRLRFNLKATLSKFFKLSVLLRKETLLPAFHALMRSSPLLSRKPPHAFGRRFPLPPPSFPQVTSQLCERIALSHFSVFLLSCSKGFTTLPTRNFSWKRSGLPQSTNTRAAQLEKRKKLPLFFTRHWEEKIKRIENRTFEGERELFKSFEDRRRPFLRVFMAAKALNRLRSRRARGSVDERRENPNVSREETAASTGSRNRLDSITESVPGRRESREDCERATTLRALRLRDVAERTRPSRHNEFQPISRKIGALDSTLSHGGRNTSSTQLESRQQRVSVR